MGSGIALAAAQSSYSVTLYDTNEVVLEKAKISISKNLNFLVENMSYHKCSLMEP